MHWVSSAKKEAMLEAPPPPVAEANVDSTSNFAKST